MGLAIKKFLSGYRWDIEYAKDSRILGAAYWKTQKQGFETELNHKKTRDKRQAVLFTIFPVLRMTAT